MKHKYIKATSIKNITITLIVIIIGISSIGIYFAFDKIDTLAKEIQSEIKKTPILGIKTDNTQALSSLQTEITKYQPIIDQINKLASNSENTKSQTMQDLNTYAAANNITISNYNFSGQTNMTALNSATTINTSIQASNVIITINSPIEYKSLIKFLKSIETNTPKMQVKNLTISADQSSSNKVKVEPITIEVYSR